MELKQTSALTVYEATEKFWTKWREDKLAMKTAGYRVIKYKNTWFVLKGA